MTPTLFNPRDPPPGIWPEGSDAERTYIEGIAAAEVKTMVANVRTQWLALRSGDRVLPVTVNDGEIGDSYVCLPHSAYVLYGRAELDIIDVGRLKPLLRAAIGVIERVLHAAELNRIAHIDNWLLSTNLHGDWDGADLPAIRTTLTARFPEHILAIRSVDPWSSPELLAAATADGWCLLPSRQIWVTDALSRDWRPRNNTANDRRALAKSGLTVEDIDMLTPGDAERIAGLYAMLYIGKYSPLNPVFTPRWISLTQASGLIRYRVARGADGTIQAVAGSLVRGDILTPPVVGYDTGAPVGDGLYRIACYLFGDYTCRNNLRLNGSAGAAEFKRNRGAHSVIEYSAVYTGHLPRRRRWRVALLATALNRIAAPIMKARQL